MDASQLVTTVLAVASIAWNVWTWRTGRPDARARREADLATALETYRKQIAELIARNQALETTNIRLQAQIQRLQAKVDELSRKLEFWEGRGGYVAD